MEDKELQELFAAKRTVEANRRRQEELRRLIEVQAASEAKPKVRRMWPVWTLSAAAGIALLLITLPALFSQEGTAPVQVAQTEVTTLPATTQEEPTDSRESRESRKSRISRKTRESKLSTDAVPQARHHEETLSNTAPVLPEPAIEEAPAIEETIETVVPTPRVMRRTSSLIACTEGCNVPEGSHEKNSRDIEVTFFAQSNCTDNIIYSFEIKK